jgi:type VI secretion system protein ImpH
LLPYAGLLWHQPRAISGLTRILEHAFGVHVAACEGIGVWRSLEPEDRTHLGARCLLPEQSISRGNAKECGRNNVLGRTAILGRRVWDAQGRFNLVLGPLSLPQFESFLPGQNNLQRLASLVRFYAGDLWDVGIELLLQEEEAHAARLGTARLGWTAWVQPQRKRGERRVCFMLPEETTANTTNASFAYYPG